jgi:hypothetical protein
MDSLKRMRERINRELQDFGPVPPPGLDGIAAASKLRADLAIAGAVCVMTLARGVLTRR